jgi:cellulose 1,4-beta-cellobiosidase
MRAHHDRLRYFLVRQRHDAGWLTLPGIPTGLGATAGDAQVVLNWTAAANATGYNVKRASVSGGAYLVVANNITALLYTNTSLSNGTRYYFVVPGQNAAGESVNSIEASAQPVSLTLPQVEMTAVADLLQFTWPADHIGWRLMAQTSGINVGLSTNWATVGGSSATNKLTVPVGVTNGSVFFRLIYP